MSDGGGHSLLVGPGGHFFKAPDGGGGSVNSVTAGDSSVTIGGTAADPTVAINLANANTWTAAQTGELSDAGTNTILRPKIIRRMTSGTAAAGLGVGQSYRLEDASGNDDEAGRDDIAWIVATDGATQASHRSFTVLTANALVETARIGGGISIITPIDVDASFSVGRTLIDQRVTDVMNISHRDHTGTNSHALQQNASGTTALNTVSGTTGFITVGGNGGIKFRWSTTGVAFYGSSAVAQQTVGANVNNVAASGTTGQFDDFTDGTTYATDYAALHATVYQLTRSVAQITVALRNYGLGA